MAAHIHITSRYFLPSPAAIHRKAAFTYLDMAADCRLAYTGRMRGLNGRIHDLPTAILAGQHQVLQTARDWLRGVESASIADARARRDGFRLPG